MLETIYFGRCRVWLLPTLNRISKLETFFKSAISAETSTPGLVLVDNEDWEKNEALYETLELPPGWRYIRTTGVSMGDKIREAWKIVKLNNSEWVGVLNDDHYIVTKNWDKLLVSALDNKNFASANDRWMAPQKATTATIWSMPLLEAVGWPIYPPFLQHLFIDDLWEAIARQTGCWRVCMNVVVEHHHALRDPLLQDDTHQKVYNQRAWEFDQATFQNVMKHDFQGVVEKIKKLQNQSAIQAYNPSPKKRVENVISDKR